MARGAGQRPHGRVECGGSHHLATSPCFAGTMISRMAAVAAACVTGALLATAAVPAYPDNPGYLPQHGGGAANDNYQPGTGGADVRRQVWQRQAGGDDTVGGAAVAGGRLTVAYGKGALRRVDVRTGAVTVLGTLAGRRPQQLA